jgi:hypothetical protein
MLKKLKIVVCLVAIATAVVLSGVVLLTSFFNIPPSPVETGPDVLAGAYINQTIPAQNLSIPIQSSVGFFSIEAQVPETPRDVPLYKGILSDDDLERHFKYRAPNRYTIKNSTPSKSEAPAIAEKALAAYGGLPPDAVLSSVFISESVTEKSSGEKTERHPIMTQVFYNREINGMPVIGERDGISVALGENGELLVVMKRWRALEKTGEMAQVIAPDKAVERLKRGETYTILQSSKTAYIDYVRLGYYEKPGKIREIVLEPVWIFKSTSEPGFEFPVYARQFAKFTEIPAEISKTVDGKTITEKDSFTATFTDTSDANPTKWLWDFGDGTISTEKNPTHSYKTAGTYNVTLTVWNDLGSDTMVNQYTVTGPAATPTIANLNATHIVANVTETLPTTILSVNETATPIVTASPTSNTTSAGEGTNQTITLPITTVTIITSTTTGFNATNSS